MLEAIRKAERRDCQRMKYEDVDEVFYITLDCVITDANKVALHAEALMRRNLKWKKNAQNVTGAKLLRRMNDKWKNSTICPVDIIVSRPIVNIVPLIAGLLLLFTVNVAVGLTVSERGDVLDAVFHLVKEVVGVDCTSNALEERQGGDVQPVIELKQWQCKGGRNIGHVGFLKGVGDYSVDGLDDVLVSSCNHAKTDGYSIGKWREKGVWKEFGITP